MINEMISADPSVSVSATSADAIPARGVVPAGCRRLVLGSGQKKQDDAINVDLVPSTNPDIVHDLNNRPWPLPDNQFDECHAYDVIEHLDNIVATMEEIHRVCRNGAVVRITVPHFSCGNAYTDPTHRHYFSCFSLNYFTGEHQFSYYSDCRFKRRANQIVFAQTLLNKLVHRLANRFPAEYERRWAWIFPAWFLYFELEVVKDAPAR
jgi:SAM-dependent methyltransferase